MVGLGGLLASVKKLSAFYFLRHTSGSLLSPHLGLKMLDLFSKKISTISNVFCSVVTLPQSIYHIGEIRGSVLQLRYSIDNANTNF